MYAGHAAIALIIKARRREVPMLPLAMACYGPDFVDIALMSRHISSGAGVYSHSIPFVIAGAVLAGSAYAVTVRRPGALMLVVGWLLHWPADALTGLKPLLLDRTVAFGLDLYHLPFADAVLEISLILIACWLYARAFAHDRAKRRVVMALAAALIVSQLAFRMVQGEVDPMIWHPRLAVAPVRTQILS